MQVACRHNSEISHYLCINETNHCKRQHVSITLFATVFNVHRIQAPYNTYLKKGEQNFSICNVFCISDYTGYRCQSMHILLVISSGGIIFNINNREMASKTKANFR